MSLLVRITSANALVPECHVEVWTLCPLSSVSGERCLQLIARSRLPIPYDLQLYTGKGDAKQQNVSGSCVSKKGFSRLAPAFDVGVRQDLLSSQQVCNVFSCRASRKGRPRTSM